jgi:hypothetical protein
MGSPEVPRLEVPKCPSGSAVVPKITKTLFDCPRTGCFQILPLQRSKPGSMSFREILTGIKPGILRPGKSFITDSFQFPMFSLTYRINRFHHVYHQMVTIKNKLCVIIRDIVANRRNVWIPDIGRNGFNPLKRYSSAAAEISIKTLFFPILSNVYDRTLGQIAHNGHIIMSTADGLFVYPYLFRSTFSLFQSSSNSFLYDAPGLVPTNTKQSRSAHDVTGFQDLDSEPFKKNRKPRIRLSPRKMNLTTP